jgi:hypothetical protein
MKLTLKLVAVTIAFILVSATASAQFKMSSDGRTLSNSSNATVGKIDSDGRTISNANNTTVGKVDSDGKTISNANGTTVLKISGNDINNANGTTIAKMSDVLNAISGAKPEAKFVALWWFIVKGNR